MAGAVDTAGGDGAMRQTAGRPAKDLSNRDVGEILGLLRSGLGRVLACDRMSLSYKTFQRLMRENEEFAGLVREAERSRIEGCEAAVFRMATRAYDSPVGLRAALAYIGRRDRLDELRRARQAKARKADE